MAELNEKAQKETEKAPAEKTEKKKNKKPNIFKRIGNLFKRIGKFFRECRSEMKKVTWLSGKETMKSSLIVVAVTVVLCFVIAAIDTGLEFGVIGLRDLSIHLGLTID